MTDNEITAKTMLAFDPAWVKPTGDMGRLQCQLVTDGRRVAVAWYHPQSCQWYTKSNKTNVRALLQDFTIAYHKDGLRERPNAPRQKQSTNWNKKKNRKLALSAMAQLAPGLEPYFPNDKRKD